MYLAKDDPGCSIHFNSFANITLYNNSIKYNSLNSTREVKEKFGSSCFMSPGFYLNNLYIIDSRFEGNKAKYGSNCL